MAVGDGRAPPHGGSQRQQMSSQHAPLWVPPMHQQPSVPPFAPLKLSSAEEHLGLPPKQQSDNHSLQAIGMGPYINATGHGPTTCGRSLLDAATAQGLSRADGRQWHGAVVPPAKYHAGIGRIASLDILPAAPAANSALPAAAPGTSLAAGTAVLGVEHPNPLAAVGIVAPPQTATPLRRTGVTVAAAPVAAAAAYAPPVPASGECPVAAIGHAAGSSSKGSAEIKLQELINSMFSSDAQIEVEWAASEGIGQHWKVLGLVGKGTTAAAWEVQQSSPSEVKTAVHAAAAGSSKADAGGGANVEGGSSSSCTVAGVKLGGPAAASAAACTAVAGSMVLKVCLPLEGLPSDVQRAGWGKAAAAVLRSIAS